MEVEVEAGLASVPVRDTTTTTSFSRPSPPVQVPRGATAEVLVLLCNERGLVRSGLRAILERAEGIRVVGEASEGREVLPAVRRLRPNVVILELRMPGLSGVEITRRLVANCRGRAVPILMIGNGEHDDQVMEALRAGARGFVRLQDGEEELVRAVRVLASGEALLAPSVTRCLLDRFSRVLPAPREPERIALAALTRRETEILRLVAEGRSNTEIAETLSLSEATIRSHAYHLRRKLDLTNRAHIVAFAYRLGMVPLDGQ